MSDSATKFFEPPANLVRGAHVSGMDAYRALVRRAEADYEGYWPTSRASC